jgi:nicotinamidase-related amidase
VLNLKLTFQEIIQDPLWHKVVYTQDWHPSDHISFHSNWRRRTLDPNWAAAHISRGKNISLFEEVVFAREPPYPQVLWPDHCVQNTPG